MRFLFACGGSAGHINPALAVAGRLRELFPEADFLFAGAGRVLERRLIPAAGFELKNITVSGLRRGVSPADIAGLQERLTDYVRILAPEAEITSQVV